MYYLWRNRFSEAYTLAKLGYQINNFGIELPESLYNLVLTNFDGDMQYIKATYQTENYLDCVKMLNNLKYKYELKPSQIDEVNGFIDFIKNNEKNRCRIL